MNTDLDVIANFLDHMQAMTREHNPESPPAPPPNADATIHWLRAQLDNWRIEYGQGMAGYKSGGGPAEGMHDALRDMWRERKAL